MNMFTKEQIAEYLRLEHGGRMLRTRYRQEVGYRARHGDMFRRTKRFSHFPEGVFSRTWIYIVIGLNRRWVKYRALKLTRS